MKNRICVIYLFIVTVVSVFAQTDTVMQNNSRITILKPNSENISSSESSWLIGAVQDKIEADFNSYTNMVLVNTTSEEKIKELQKKFEGGSYSSKDALTVGELTTARYGLFSTIRKTVEKYTLSEKIIDLEKGTTVFTAISEGSQNIDDLYTNAGCAVDLMTLKMCETLGFPLTAEQKYILQNGDKDISAEDQVRLAQETAVDFQKQMNDLDKQIEVLSADKSDLTAAAAIAQIEAQKALYQEKLNATNTRLARLQEDAKAKSADEQRESERTAEQKKQRQLLAEAAQKKVDELQRKKMSNLPVLSQLMTIENKKKALVEIRESIEKKAEEIQNDNLADFQEYKKETLSKPYGMGDMDENGKPLSEAVSARNKIIENKKKDIDKETEIEVRNLETSTNKQEEDLLKDIRNDQKSIAEKRTISSLDDSANDNLRVTVSSYNGKEQAWHVYYYVISQDIILYQNEFYLSYVDLTGATSIPAPGTPERDKYNDDIEVYTSLFNRKVPVLAYEMDYKVTSAPDDKPSEYEFSFSELRIMNTVTGKVIKKAALSDALVTRTFNPKYDIRDRKVIITTSEKYQNKMERYKPFDQKIGNGKLNNIRGCVGKSFPDGINFSITALIPCGPYYFIILEGGYTPVPLDCKTLTDSNNMYYGMAGQGFAKRLMIGRYPPCIYGYAGGGVCSFKINGCFITSDSENSEYKYDDAFVCGFAQLSLGLELPVSKYFAFYGQVNGDIAFSKRILGLSGNGSLGVSFKLPWWK